MGRRSRQRSRTPHPLLQRGVGGAVAVAARMHTRGRFRREARTSPSPSSPSKSRAARRAGAPPDAALVEFALEVAQHAQREERHQEAAGHMKMAQKLLAKNEAREPKEV